MTPATLRAWLAALVPELADIYVVFVSQLPPRPWAKADLLGLTTRGLDLVLKPHLDWHGRAPAVLLDDRALVQEAAGLVLGCGLEQEEAEWFAFGRVLLHEAAHVLTRRPPYFDTSEPAPALDVDGLGLMLGVQSELLAALFPNIRVGGDHGAVFTRIACHLSWRARREGQDIRPGAVVPGPYDQPPANLCGLALGDEPEQLACWPVEAIKCVPPPESFATLWAAQASSARASRSPDRLF